MAPEQFSEFDSVEDMSQQQIVLLYGGVSVFCFLGLLFLSGGASKSPQQKEMEQLFSYIMRAQIKSYSIKAQHDTPLCCDTA